MTIPDDVARAVVRLPLDFMLRGDVSFYALTVESGYAIQHSNVRIQEIERALRAQPELVKEWLQYSEDKRCSSGWYFCRGMIRKWKVGYIGDDKPNTRSMGFGDEFIACATFIKKELDSVLAPE